MYQVPNVDRQNFADLVLKEASFQPYDDGSANGCYLHIPFDVECSNETFLELSIIHLLVDGIKDVKLESRPGESPLRQHRLYDLLSLLGFKQCVIHSLTKDDDGYHGFFDFCKIQYNIFNKSVTKSPKLNKDVAYKEYAKYYAQKTYENDEFDMDKVLEAINNLVRRGLIYYSAKVLINKEPLLPIPFSYHILEASLMTE